MRAFGHRWGCVLAILGLPILARGLATSNVLALWGGSTLIVLGAFLWVFFRSWRKTSEPGPQSE
jgi:hypothetical protein